MKLIARFIDWAFNPTPPPKSGALLAIELAGAVQAVSFRLAVENARKGIEKLEREMPGCREAIAQREVLNTLEGLCQKYETMFLPPK